MREAGLKLKQEKNGKFPSLVMWAVRDCPTPTTVSEVKGFLGLLNYYRRFIPGFFTKAEPLNSLTRKKVEFKWGYEQERAFCELKRSLVQPPVIAYPDCSTSSGQFILDTDASTLTETRRWY